jgi:hypothetical protein
VLRVSCILLCTFSCTLTSYLTCAADQEELLRCIVDAAHRLDRHRVREDLFGIQFVQIGTDQAAAEVLHELDDHLVEHYKIRVRRRRDYVV